LLSGMEATFSTDCLILEVVQTIKIKAHFNWHS